jgi:hypothetical protein
MPRSLRRSRSRGQIIAISFAILVVTNVACLTVAPSELPGAPAHRPEILVDTAQPPVNQILYTWPLDSTFRVAVEIDEPLTSAEWVGFFDGVATSSPLTVTGPGTALVPLNVPLPTPTQCHTIELRVAHQVSSAPPYTPDSLGSDSITWFYFPNGAPNGCPIYDAGLDPGVGPIDGQAQ